MVRDVSFSNNNNIGINVFNECVYQMNYFVGLWQVDVFSVDNFLQESYGI